MAFFNVVNWTRNVSVNSDNDKRDVLRSNHLHSVFLFRSFFIVAVIDFEDIFFFVWLFFSGNNDLFIDYVPPTENDSSLYVSLKQIFEPHLFPNLHNASSMVMDEFRATFEEGGYYRFTLQGKN